MPEEQRKQEFWTSLPGVLTGIAAVITACAGLILGLYQYGVLGSRQGTSEFTEASKTTQAPAPATRLSQESPASAPSQQGQQDNTVVVTAADGTVTTLYTDSFRLYGGGDHLSLRGGQSIPLNRIRTIDVVRVDSSVDTKIRATLADGRSVEGSIGPEWVQGTNDLGGFELSVAQLKQIAFPR